MTGLFSQSLPDSTDSAEYRQELEDPWLGFDKVQHFTYSFLWTLSTQYVLESKMGMARETAIWLSPVSATAAGLGKELYDRKKPGGFFSKRDLVANIAGIAVAVAVILL